MLLHHKDQTDIHTFGCVVWVGLILIPYRIVLNLLYVKTMKLVRCTIVGTQLKGNMGVSHSRPLKLCYFTGQKRQYNVFLQANFLGLGPFDQLLFLKKCHRKSLQDKATDTPNNTLKLRLYTFVPSFRLKSVQARSQGYVSGVA